MPILTQHLTAADYGIYGVITSYLFFVTAFKDLGLVIVFVNSYYKFPHRWKLIWRMLYGHLVFWGLIYLAIVLVLLKFAIPAEAQHNYLLIAALIIIPTLFFENTNLLGGYYYRFSEKPAYITIVSIVTTLLTLGITYYCVVIEKLGYLSWFIASAASGLIMFLFYVYPVYGKLKLWPILRFRKKFIVPHLKVSLPIIPHQYSVFLLNSSDRVVLDLYKVNIDRIGQYNVAYQFGGYFDILGEGVGMAVGPYYSKLYVQRTLKAEQSARMLTFFLAGAFFLGTFLVSLWLKEIFQLLIRNAELRVAYDIGVIVIMGYAYRPLYWASANKMAIFEKTNMLWRTSFVAGVLNVILNVIFVPYYGIYAAAIATFISLMFMGFAGFYFKSYKNLSNTLDHYPMAWLLTLLVLTAAVYWLKEVHYGIKIIITLASIGGALYWTWRNYPRLQTIEI